ncbi:MAG: SRPBCC family protein [Chloroflexi bacterium]|nr:SRPBCC family protein [Chloroflexota bacterium]
MVRYEKTIEIAAQPAVVWEVIRDVERWPEWTPTMKYVRLREPGPLALGSTADVDVDGAGRSTLRVTEYTEGRSFTWSATVRGVRFAAAHIVEPAGAGSRATLWVEFRGVMAAIFAPMLRRTAHRNVDIEAEGLKRRSEETARAGFPASSQRTEGYERMHTA